MVMGQKWTRGLLFFWEAVGHKHGLMLHRKFMWLDRYSATGCSSALQAVDSKQAENLSVGKTKSYWTNNNNALAMPGFDHGVGHSLLLLYDAKGRVPELCG
jgi:hypothetical protein